MNKGDIYAIASWKVCVCISVVCNPNKKRIKMTLKEKLEKLKKQQLQKTAPDWENYKKVWIDSVKDLQNMIMYKWFENYDKEGLMEFSIIPTKRIDPYIGEYLTTILEITLTNNKYLVLEPITAITADYDGKVEFYMRGNVYKKVSILRKIIDDKKHEWIIAKSYDLKDNYRLDKGQLEKLIEQWVQETMKI